MVNPMDNPFQDLLFLDVETTGLLFHPNARIVEISLSIWTKEGHRTRFTSLIDPQEPIPVHYTEIHGIDDEMVRNAPTFSEFWKERGTLFQNKTIVAHNLSFDMGMLNREILRQEQIPLGNPGIDTVPVLRKLLPMEKSHKLRNLAVSLGVVQQRIHRAEEDVKALEQVLSIALQLPLERLLGPLGIDLALWGGFASHRYFQDCLWWAQRTESPLHVFLAKMGDEEAEERTIEEFRLERPACTAKRLGEFKEKGRYPMSWTNVYRVSNG